MNRTLCGCMCAGMRAGNTRRCEASSSPTREPPFISIFFLLRSSHLLPPIPSTTISALPRRPLCPEPPEHKLRSSPSSHSRATILLLCSQIAGVSALLCFHRKSSSPSSSPLHHHESSSLYRPRHRRSFTIGTPFSIQIRKAAASFLRSPPSPPRLLCSNEAPPSPSLLAGNCSESSAIAGNRLQARPDAEPRVLTRFF